MTEKCPVCNGRGIVPGGFYSFSSIRNTDASNLSETCRSCNGKGYIIMNECKNLKLGPYMLKNGLYYLNKRKLYIDHVDTLDELCSINVMDKYGDDCTVVVKLGFINSNNFYEIYTYFNNMWVKIGYTSVIDV